jgi:hypothetical protein
VEAVAGRGRGRDHGDGNGKKLAAITEGGDKDADRHRWAAMRRCGAMTTHVQRRNIAVAARAIAPLAAGRSIVVHGMVRRWPSCWSACSAAGSLVLP